MAPRRALVGVVSVVVLGVGSATPATADDTAATTGQAARVLGQCTLVTGDRVTVHEIAGKPVPRVEPAKGRERVRFAVHRAAEHLFVVPQDAVGLVGAELVDRRLFDVTMLLRYRYDDAHRADLPLIMQTNGEQPDVLRGAGAQVGHVLSSINGIAVSQPKRDTARLWNAVAGDGSPRTLRGVSKIWLDGLRRPTLDVSVPQIGAPQAWALGYTGKGVTVAVLDTGIDATHPDFAGKIADAKNFTSAPEADDTVGHGTHVASIIAGSGAKSGGRYRGVAPDARLLNGKVCASNSCAESDILAGMQWAAETGVKVINFSIGGWDTPELDPLEQAINALTARHDTLFVAAAGNSGFAGGETLDSSASADAALAVGAVDKQDTLAPFSSRGPRVGDAALKPDITAPGVDIVAAKATNGVIGAPVVDGYVSLSGTSMATPHAAGAIAVLAQQHDDWTAMQLKAALMGSANPNATLGAYAQGAGRVDVARAVTQSVYVDPPSVSAGRAMWPHGDDPDISKTVAYRNTGSTPVEFELALTASGPDGKPAPDGMFALNTQRVMVPAGGQASVDVSIDTRVAGADGYYTGRITASAGDTVLVTPVAVNKEVESYDLTLHALDRDGNAAGTNVLIAGLGDGKIRFADSPNGTTIVRLPKGNYHLHALISTPRGQASERSMLVQPLLEVSKDTTVTLDARQAKPIEVTFAKDTIQPALVAIAYERVFADGTGMGMSLSSTSFAGLSTAHLGTAVPREEFVGGIHGLYAIPDSAGQFRRSDQVYNVAWFSAGRMFTGFASTVEDRQLATVRSTYHRQANGRQGIKLVMARGPGMTGGTGLGIMFDLPMARSEYYLAEGVVWAGSFVQLLINPDGSSQYEAGNEAQQTTYRAGRTYHERWNSVVFGPAFPGRGDWMVRHGDKITVLVPLFSDATPDHAGFSEVTSTHTVLYRDGWKIGETDRAHPVEFEVPPGVATYRLETEAQRSGVSEFSTETSATWTFRSRHVDALTPLPVQAIRFAPTVDMNNRAPADTWFTLPISVQHQSGIPWAPVRTLKVEASYDDGNSWQQVSVSPVSRDQWTGRLLRHPAHGGYVSLRAQAEDTAGNLVQQTIIRAYGLTTG